MKMFFRAEIECTDDQGNPHGKSVWAFTVYDLVDKISKLGDMWTINHAHKLNNNQEVVKHFTNTARTLLQEKRSTNYAS